MNRYVFVLTTLCAILYTTATFSASFDLPVDETVLNNGMTLLISSDTMAATVSVFTFVNAGSRDEDRPGITGLAHVFEHMMFRGTEKFPNFSAVVAPLGAESNAWTTNDYTAYFLNAEAQFLDRLLEIESDRIRNLIFTNETFRTELGPVKEERRRGVDDDPDGFLSVELERLAYKVHTYHHPVIGWEEDLEENMTFEDGLEFKNRHYAPNNCVLVISGNVDIDHTKQLVDQFYGDWERGTAYASLVVAEPNQTEERSKSFVWKDDETPVLIRMGFHMPSVRDDFDAFVAVELINEILFSKSGRLTNKLKNELSLVESVSGDAEMRKDPGLASIAVRLRRGSAPAEVKDTIYNHLQLLGTSTVPEAELDRARNNLRARLIYNLHSPSRIAASLGIHHVQSGNHRGVTRLYDSYDTVSPEKIQSVAAQIFATSNRSVVMLTPKRGI